MVYADGDSDADGPVLSLAVLTSYADGPDISPSVYDLAVGVASHSCSERHTSQILSSTMERPTKLGRASRGVEECPAMRPLYPLHVGTLRADRKTSDALSGFSVAVCWCVDEMSGWSDH